MASRTVKPPRDCGAGRPLNLLESMPASNGFEERRSPSETQFAGTARLSRRALFHDPPSLCGVIASVDISRFLEIFVCRRAAATALTIADLGGTQIAAGAPKREMRH